MHPTHGYWCNTRTFPINCRDCKAGVYFFMCDCGSRVFFDDLGYPWPIHDCGASRVGTSGSGSSAPRPSGRMAWSSLTGVTFSKQDPNYGLLPGMKRFNGSIDEGISGRVKRTDPVLRETMRMDPIGDRQEELLGVVSDIHHMALGERFAIGADTVGAEMIVKQLGRLDVTQITILVDDIDVDPEAVDLMSYTAWWPENVSEALAIGDVVRAAVLPKDIWGIGRRWVVDSLKVLS